MLAALMLAISAAPAQGVRVGAAAPEIDLQALDGTRVRLSKLRGYGVVVSFWATWCPPCRSEFRELVTVHDAFEPNGIRVLAVNGRDQEFSTGHVRRFVEEFAVRFPVVLDKRGKARRAYGLIGLPTTVFIDSAGVVKVVHLGPIDRQELMRGISAIRSQ